MPIVYSYYHPVPSMDYGVESYLITCWRNSWHASEFIPVLLSHQVAEAHPRAEEFMAVVKRFPSVNASTYELACWMRWLALAQMKGGLMTDYDVIARAFSPEFLALPDDVTVLDRGGVPCAVHATPEGAEMIVDNIINIPPPIVTVDGRPHSSDMLHYQKMGYTKHLTLTAPYGAPDWKTAPAVHFSHADCFRENPKLKRHLIIKKEMGFT